MTLPTFHEAREMTKFVESSSVPGQVGIVALGPDGSTIGSSSVISSITPGTDTTNLGTAEDQSVVDGKVGVLSLTKRQDTPSTDTGGDGRAQPQKTDSTGHTWTREGYAAASEDNTNGVLAVVQKPLTVNTYGFTKFKDLGANVTANIKSSAGNLFSVYCHNLNAASRYLQIHDTATTPSGGAVPIFSFLVETGKSVSYGTDFFGTNGIPFTNGIAFAFSTTEGTYTAGSASDQFTLAHVK